MPREVLAFGKLPQEQIAFAIAVPLMMGLKEPEKGAANSLSDHTVGIIEQLLGITYQGLTLAQFQGCTPTDFAYFITQSLLNLFKQAKGTTDRERLRQCANLLRIQITTVHISSGKETRTTYGEAAHFGIDIKHTGDNRFLAYIDIPNEDEKERAVRKQFDTAVEAWNKDASLPTPPAVDSTAKTFQALTQFAASPYPTFTISHKLTTPGTLNLCFFNVVGMNIVKALTASSTEPRIIAALRQDLEPVLNAHFSKQEQWLFPRDWDRLLGLPPARLSLLLGFVIHQQLVRSTEHYRGATDLVMSQVGQTLKLRIVLYAGNTGELTQQQVYGPSDPSLNIYTHGSALSANNGAIGHFSALFTEADPNFTRAMETLSNELGGQPYLNAQKYETLIMQDMQQRPLALTSSATLFKPSTSSPTASEISLADFWQQLESLTTSTYGTAELQAIISWLNDHRSSASLQQVFCTSSIGYNFSYSTIAYLMVAIAAGQKKPAEIKLDCLSGFDFSTSIDANKPQLGTYARPMLQWSPINTKLTIIFHPRTLKNFPQQEFDGLLSHLKSSCQTAATPGLRRS